MMFGVGTIVKLTPLLSALVATTTFPVVANVGTGTTIFVALQLVGIPVTPLKASQLEPCVDPKPVPLTVTEVPAWPEVGETLVIIGTAPTT
jgi:hypothetical protein